MFTRRRLPVVLSTVLVALLIAAGSVQAAPAIQGGGTVEAALAPPHAPDRIVVKFKQGVSAADRAAIHAARGAVVFRSNARLGTTVIHVDPDQLANTIADYRADPRVVYAEPDYIAHIAYEPDDPKYGDGTQWGPQRMQADLAWDLSNGDPSAVVAIIDFGVDLTHPDLQSQLWTNPGEIANNGVDDDGNGYVDDVYGWDFPNDDNDPQDDHGHGSHVAGIAAAATDNATGVAAVGFNSSIMAVKAGYGETGAVAYSDIAWSLYYAADNGADVINLSVGGYSNPSYLADAVDYAWSKGCVLIGAAGNDNRSEPFYPAAYSHVIGVSATDQSDARASWSNWGDYISVAAPGVGIHSTFWNNGSTYASMSGTSMAAPHVAGLAALLLAQDGSRSNADVRGLIEGSADDLGDAGWDPYFGHGRVNAFRALGQAAGMASTIVDPVQGGTLHSADGDLTLTFPGGSVSTRTIVDHMPQVSPSYPPDDLLFAQMACLLQAIDADGNLVESFDPPFTLALHYQDEDWQEAGIDDETQLNLYYWDGVDWRGVLPCDGCSLDIENNELVAQLDHFSEFGLMGEAGTTSVTLASFGAQHSNPELTKSVITGTLGLLGLVGLLVAVVLLKLKYPLPSTKNPRR